MVVVVGGGIGAAFVGTYHNLSGKDHFHTLVSDIGHYKFFHLLYISA